MHGAVAHRVVVWLLLHKLWRHVEWRPLDGGHHHGVARHGARKAKVAELDDTPGTNENVLRLHVAVDDAVAMQILKAYYQIGNEEFGLSLCELSPSADVIPACLESYLRSPPLT